MAKKNKPVNTGTPKGIFRIREAGKNPANKKMFNIIANGELDENIVDKSYTMVDIEFVDNELDCVCRVLTRDKIQAYANDIDRSVETLANQFIQGLAFKDNASEITQKIIDDVAATFDHDDDEIKKIVVMSIIRNAIIGATDIVKTVNVAANDSEVVEDSETIKTVEAEESDKTIETNTEPEVIDVEYSKVDDDAEPNDFMKQLMDNKMFQVIIKSLGDNSIAEDFGKLMELISKDPDLNQKFNLDDIIKTHMSPEAREKLFGSEEKPAEQPVDKTVHDIRKEKVSEAVNQKSAVKECIALIECGVDKSATKAYSILDRLSYGHKAMSEKYATVLSGAFN